MSNNNYKLSLGYEDGVKLADPGEDEEDYWPEGVPHNYAWNESTRDWGGSGVLDGLEGTMNITVSYFGCTEEQRQAISLSMAEFGSRARDLFNEVVNKKMTVSN
jgi:hypothetical protein